MRILQTQHQIAFDIAEFSTDPPHCCNSFSEVNAMVLSANRIILSVKSRPLILLYHYLFDSITSNLELQSLGIMPFSDCGFATLWDSESVEAVFVILSRQWRATELFGYLAIYSMVMPGEYPEPPVAQLQEK